MKIDAIEVFHLGLPLVAAVETPLGRFEKLETVLVALRSGETVGWGEASPGVAPLAGPDWAGGVYACVSRWIAPLLKGATVDSGGSLEEALAPIVGNRHAKAAVDAAWWDLHARLRGEPLAKVLGGEPKGLELCTSFDRMETIELLLEAIRGAVEAGYSAIELKFRPGWDVQMVNIVRSEFAVETIHIDVEGAMSLAQMEMLCRLDDFSLAMIEQPLPAEDLVGHAMVQEAVRTPVCLAEGITNVSQAELAMELHSCHYVNLEPGRVGGLTAARTIHDMCHDACTPCRLGAVPQTAVGTRIGLALATKSNFNYPAQHIAPGTLLAEDLAEPPATRRNEAGMLEVVLDQQPGIGVEPDRGLMEKWCVARTEV